MDTKTIFKIKKTKTNRYITVFTDFIRSKDLTPDEKYLIIYFLTLPDDWKIHKNKIWTEMNITFGSFRKAWNNLKNLGYISVTRTHKNRLVDGYNIKIYENPHEPLNFHGRVENEPSEEPLNFHGRVENEPSEEPLNFHGRVENEPSEEPLNFHGRVENEPSEEDSLGLFDKNMIISENPILPRKGRNPYVRKSTLIHNIDQHNGVFPDPSKGSGGKTPSILDQNLELVTGPGTRSGPDTGPGTRSGPDTGPGTRSGDTRWVFPDPSKGSGGKTPSILDQNLELVTGPGTGTSNTGPKKSNSNVEGNITGTDVTSNDTSNGRDSSHFCDVSSRPVGTKILEKNYTEEFLKEFNDIKFGSDLMMVKYYKKNEKEIYEKLSPKEQIDFQINWAIERWEKNGKII